MGSSRKVVRVDMTSFSLISHWYGRLSCCIALIGLRNYSTLSESRQTFKGYLIYDLLFPNKAVMAWSDKNEANDFNRITLKRIAKRTMNRSLTNTK